MDEALVMQFGFYWSALEHCSMCILEFSDTEMGSYIFEDFDTEHYSFLRINLLREFEYAGLISAEIRVMSGMLSSSFSKLKRGSSLAIPFIRSSEAWMGIFRLSDDIKGRIRVWLGPERLKELTE